MKLEILKHPLVVLLVGSGLALAVGNCIGGCYARQNIALQVKLERYKEEIKEQDELISSLTIDVYSRLYYLKRVFYNLRDNDVRKNVSDNYEKYNEAKHKWNELWRCYYTKIDRYFPIDSFPPSRFIKIDNMELRKSSFRNILEGEIQERFMVLNDIVRENVSAYLNGKNLSQDEKALLSNKINEMDKIVDIFVEALSKASEEYKNKLTPN